MGTEPRLPVWSHLAESRFAVELGKMTKGQQSIRVKLDTMAKVAEAALRKP